jgi:hypothetical protein
MNKTIISSGHFIGLALARAAFCSDTVLFTASLTGLRSTVRFLVAAYGSTSQSPLSFLRKQESTFHYRLTTSDQRLIPLDFRPLSTYFINI